MTGDLKSTTIWSGFWPIVGAVSIRTKVMGIAAVCILIAALALVWSDYRGTFNMLSDQLQKRGISIAAGLAAQSRDSMLTMDHFTIYRLVRNTLYSDEDLTYILVLDNEYNVLVHTFDQSVPLELLDLNQLYSEDQYQVQALRTEDGIIYDVAVPILGGQAGIVRVGMSAANIRAEVNQQFINGLLWVAIVLVIGLYIAYGMAAFLTKPISQLAVAARLVGTDRFRWNTPAWAKDEIGSLGDVFNEVSEKLRHKEEMQEQLLGKVIRAQEEERKRVARELHDEVGQALTIIMMDLAQTRDMLPSEATEAKKRVSQSRSVAERSLIDLRKLIYELRPEVLDQLGLVAALRSYIRSRLQTEDIKVRLHLDEMQNQLSAEIETILFRVIQEAINNIIRHSRATMVEINMKIEDSMVLATVKDNGIGFNVEAKLTNTESFGLLGIRERVALVGGGLSIESQVGRGSCLKVSIPLSGV